MNDIIGRLEDAMDSQYIQENTDVIIELLCEAAAEIRYRTNLLSESRDIAMNELKRCRREKDDVIKEFCKYLVDHSDGGINAGDIPDLYIEFIGGSENAKK